MIRRNHCTIVNERIKIHKKNIKIRKELCENYFVMFVETLETVETWRVNSAKFSVTEMAGSRKNTKTVAGAVQRKKKVVQEKKGTW